MASFLRDLPEGTRFMLCRSGKRYQLVRRERVKGRLKHVVQRDDSELESTLHHSCRVKPIVRAANLGVPSQSICLPYRT